MLTLSLFSGAGLLDMAFEQEGFCVVRGPELIFGGDIRSFHVPAGRFDGVIGGPPCQAFSRLRHIVKANGYECAPNLIPEFERVVSEAAPSWFLMENVPDAPLPVVPGYVVHAYLVSDEWCGGLTSRVRRFSFGTRDGLRLELEPRVLELRAPGSVAPAVLASGGQRAVPVALGGSGKLKRSAKGALKNMGYKDARSLKEAIRLQGLPADFLEDAPFTVAGKLMVVGNGVPLAMGRAVASAVRRALNGDLPSGR